MWGCGVGWEEQVVGLPVRGVGRSAQVYAGVFGEGVGEAAFAAGARSHGRNEGRGKLGREERLFAVPGRLRASVL